MDLAKKYRRHSQKVIRSRRWKALRFAALRRDDFKCRECGARGRLEVDHIEPVRDAPEKAFDLDNLQSICRVCHSRKTATEVGLPPMNPDRLAWRKAVFELTRKRTGESHA